MADLELVNLDVEQELDIGEAPSVVRFDRACEFLYGLYLPRYDFCRLIVNKNFMRSLLKASNGIIPFEALSKERIK